MLPGVNVQSAGDGHVMQPASAHPAPACDAVLAEIDAATQGLAEAVACDGSMEPAEVEARVERLLLSLRSAGASAPGYPVNHYFCGHLYAREILIPKGSFNIGEIQKYPHLSTISMGEISMLNARGGLTLIRAPFTMVGAPGVRKCGYAHEDTVWVTTHDMSASGITDLAAASIEELEAFIAVKTKDEWLLHLQRTERIGAPT